jgi:site-specific recombinase XerD
LGPERPLVEVVAESLESWASELKSNDHGSASIRRKFATARVFFSYWVRKGILDRSPMWKIRLDLGRDRVLPRSLPPMDATHLIERVWREVDPCVGVALKANDPRLLVLRDAAAMEILFATGIRVGELVSLNLQDWREDEATFLVTGKGSRERLAFLPDERSLEAVRQYLFHRNKMELVHAGIERKVTPHMIRHTVATLLLRFGTDIRIVQEILGHASIATTQRYTHVSKDLLFSTLRTRGSNVRIGHGASRDQVQVRPESHDVQRQTGALENHPVSYYHGQDAKKLPEGGGRYCHRLSSCGPRSSEVDGKEAGRVESRRPADDSQPFRLGS